MSQIIPFNERLATWCLNNGLVLSTNQEYFYFSENLTIRPIFKINDTYIEVVDPKAYNFEVYQSFAASKGPILLIPREMLSNFLTLTREEIEKYFNHSF